MLQLNPTMACNLNCLFCRRQDGLREYFRTRRELSDAKYLEIVQDAAAMGVRALNIKGGGEPLLRRSLARRLIQRIKASGISGSLITNGTVIDDDLADIFVQSGWDEVSISLDGADAATHDFLRDKPGTFDRIMASLERIVAAKRRRGSEFPRLKFHLVLTNRNCLQLERFVRLAADRGVAEIEIDSLNTSVPLSERLALGPGDLIAFEAALSVAAAAAEGAGLRHNLRDFFRPDYVERKPQMAPDGDERPIGRDPGEASAACLFPWFHATITSDGRLAPCCYGEANEGGVTLHEVSFRSAWLDSAMGPVRRAMLDGSMMPYCRDCTAGYRDQSERVRTLLAGAPAGGRG